MSILKKFDLTGKCALINHPEQVYGREIAAGLMDAGAKVWFSGPDLAALEDLAGALAEEGHEVSGIFRYSQGTREAADALGEAVKEEMPSLDIIVENSSGMHMTGWDQSFEDIYRQLTVTQTGVMLTVQSLGRVMVSQGRKGSLILVSDYSALVGCDPYNYIGAPEDAALCARLDEALEQLRQELPDIAVERVPLAEEETCDLLVLSASESAARCAGGSVAELTKEPEAAALFEKLLPAERARLGAKHTGLPLDAAEFYCFFANKAVFEELGLALPEDIEGLIACARTLAPAGRGLFTADAETGELLFALLLRAHDGRGAEAVCSGEASPYDQTWWLAADELYRLQRAGAFLAESEEEAALLLVPSGEAPRVSELWGEDAALLRFPWAGIGEKALGPAGEPRVLAVSTASEHPTLAVTAACRLCELVSRYDGLYGCGGVLSEDASGACAPAEEAAVCRAGLSAVAEYTLPSEAALAAALEEGVRELCAGRMTPDEFVEFAALSLDR